MLKTTQNEGSLEVRARPSECYERLQLEAMELYSPLRGQSGSAETQRMGH